MEVNNHIAAFGTDSAGGFGDYEVDRMGGVLFLGLCYLSTFESRLGYT